MENLRPCGLLERRLSSIFLLEKRCFREEGLDRQRFIFGGWKRVEVELCRDEYQVTRFFQVVHQQHARTIERRQTYMRLVYD